MYECYLSRSNKCKQVNKDLVFALYLLSESIKRAFMRAVQQLSHQELHLQHEAVRNRWRQLSAVRFFRNARQAVLFSCLSMLPSMQKKSSLGTSTSNFLLVFRNDLPYHHNCPKDKKIIAGSTMGTLVRCVSIH